MKNGGVNGGGSEVHNDKTGLQYRDRTLNVAGSRSVGVVT